jgi:hypothetical protein
MFGNRILRRIFGSKTQKVTEDRRKFHNERLCNLYSSSNIIRLIKTRRTRVAENVASMGNLRNAYEILVG